MDYHSLEHYIKKRMSMTHIYQPLMIKTLLESEDGIASAETIAKAFLNEDRSQLEYYMDRVKVWPHKTLTKHKVVKYTRADKGRNGTYRLLLDEVTPEQRKKLMEFCDCRLQDFIDRDPWIIENRLLDRRGVSGTLATLVRAKCRGVCVACGQSALNTPMDIDHIVPVKYGGKTELDNLQLMCYRCNRQKRDTDDTDFMLYHKRLQFRNPKCSFCVPKNKKFENLLAYVSEFEEKYQVVPHSHVGSFGELIPAERNLCFQLVDRLRVDHDEFNMRFSSDEHCRIVLTRV